MTEPVRMVAIDEEWSAVRFRRVDLVKNMARAEEYLVDETRQRRAGQKVAPYRDASGSQAPNRISGIITFRVK